MPPLFAAPLGITLAILVILFGCVLGSMFVLSRAVPVLVSDSHAKSQWLDGLRGTAACLVALDHAPLVTINAQIVPKVFCFPTAVHPLFGLLGGVGVQLFFCTTGMLFTQKLLFADKIDWSDFFLKRVRRIFPAYIVAGAAALAFAVWMSGSLKIGATTIPAVFSFGLMSLPNINGVEMARLIGVNWTLAYEWRFYMALPIIFVVSRRYPVGALAILTAYAFADSLLTQNSLWVFFVSGALASLLVKREFPVWAKRVALVVGAVALGAVFARWRTVPVYGFQQWIAVSVLFSMLAIAKPRLLALKPLVALGTVSYSFYLFHAMVLLAVMLLCNRWFFDVAYLTPKSFALLAGATLALATFIATVSYLFVERPFLKPATARTAAPVVA